MSKDKIDLKVVFNKHVDPPVKVDLSSLVTVEGDEVKIAPVTEKDSVPQVAGNPASQNLTHPAHSACLLQSNSDFSFVSPGNILTLKDIREDVGETDLWRNFEGVVRCKAPGTVKEIQSKKGKIIIGVFDNECKKGELTKYEVEKGADLLVEEEDLLEAGQPLVSGDLIGKGSPFICIPLFFRYRRYYNSTEGKCVSLEGKVPKFLPPWSGGKQNFTCYQCPKKNKETVAKGEKKCAFSVVVNFIGGPDLSTLYKFTLRSTNLNVYSNKMFRVLKNVGYPHSVIFLMDTIVREGKDQDGKVQKWYGYDVVDVAKTPQWLIPHCVEAKKALDDHYAGEDEMVKQTQSQMSYSGGGGQRQQQEAPKEDDDEAWGGEFDGDEPPF